MNRTLTERARNIKLQADMSQGFWVETINRSPSTTVDLQIPEKIWRGKSADYSTLRIFGCQRIV